MAADDTTRRLNQAQNTHRRRSLSTAGLANQPKRFAFVEVKVDAVDRDNVAARRFIVDAQILDLEYNVAGGSSLIGCLDLGSCGPCGFAPLGRALATYFN